VLVFLIGALSAHAYENEPKEFRGLPWGTPILGLSDMVLVLDGGALKAYVRKDDDLTLGDAKLDRIHYIFYEGQFYCVYVQFTGATNFNEVHSALVEWHGPGEESSSTEKHYSWSGRATSLTLNYNGSTTKGELGYKYMPIDLQIASDEKSQTE
jgi:hypothetical protein